MLVVMSGTHGFMSEKQGIAPRRGRFPLGFFTMIIQHFVSEKTDWRGDNEAVNKAGIRGNKGLVRLLR